MLWRQKKSETVMPFELKVKKTGIFSYGSKVSRCYVAGRWRLQRNREKVQNFRESKLGLLASFQNREKGRACLVLDYRSEFRGLLIPGSCIPQQGITPRTRG